MAEIWSTDQVRPQDRLTYWAEVVCRTLVPVDCIARTDLPFAARIETSELGKIRVNSAAGTPQTASRQPWNVARNPRDYLALTIHCFGTTAMTQLGREAVPGPGDIIVNDMNKPFEFNFTTDWAQTILLIPREALRGRVGNIERHVGVRLDAATGLAGVLSPLLGGLAAHVDRIPDDAREQVADGLLDLIATAILFSGEQPSETPSMTLARVKLWIERHLDEVLTAELIAAQCGLSSRHLNRLFARENTSLMQFVLERRLARCHRDLTNSAMRGRSITDIALTAGFNDLSHFSRSYRARYGSSPREVRFSGAHPA